MLKYYIYRHIRPDKNVPFYIGRGENYNDRSIYRRSKSLKGRNYIWKSIVKKNDDNYLIEILYESNSLSEIMEKEIEFIKLYGKIIDGTGTLCNLTNGGDGSLGLKHTQEARKKMSENRKNNPKYIDRLRSPEFKVHRAFILKKNGYIGSMNGKKHSKSTIDLMKKQRMGGCNVNAKKVINKLTGVIYDCVGDASIKEGINRECLYKYLRGTRTNKTNLEYYHEQSM